MIERLKFWRNARSNVPAGRRDGVFSDHVNRIDDEIIAQIRRSKFLVADLTGHRNGVYFEAGFMLGLGRPVIWLCNESEFDKVHFDTRQYNTIKYQKVEELKPQIAASNRSNPGQGAAPARLRSVAMLATVGRSLRSASNDE